MAKENGQTPALVRDGWLARDGMCARHMVRTLCGAQPREGRGAVDQDDICHIRRRVAMDRGDHFAIDQDMAQPAVGVVLDHFDIRFRVLVKVPHQQQAVILGLEVQNLGRTLCQPVAQVEGIVAIAL